MMRQDSAPLFDTKAEKSRRVRASKGLKRYDNIFASYMEDEILDNLELINYQPKAGLCYNLPGFRNLPNCDMDIAYKYREERQDALIYNEELSTVEDFKSCYDFIYSHLSIHLLNNPLSALKLYNALLRKNKRYTFFASLFSEATLEELKQVLYAADLEILGGISPRIIPYISMKDAGRLFQNAGFRNVAVDSRKLTLYYDSIRQIAYELRGIANTNFLSNRNKTYCGKRYWRYAEELYRDRFFCPKHSGIKCTFEILIMTAWYID